MIGGRFNLTLTQDPGDLLHSVTFDAELIDQPDYLGSLLVNQPFVFVLRIFSVSAAMSLTSISSADSLAFSDIITLISYKVLSNEGFPMIARLPSYQKRAAISDFPLIIWF